MSVTLKGGQVLKGALTPRGNDGISPTVEVAESENGHVVEITDAKGKKSFEVRDGYTPKKGVDYSDGVSVTHEWNGTTLKVKSASGESSADLKGDKGDPFVYSDFTAAQLAALKGDPGYTPKKNVDYFDGEKGDPGYTPVKGKDYVDGKDGVSATHRWNGTTLTVTSAAGTSSADLKGDPGNKGDPGDRGELGHSVFYSTETFPDVEVGFGRNLTVAAISLSGRTLQVNDMVLTADGLLWNVTSYFEGSHGTAGAKCVSNLRGAADAQGYSIYYSSQVTNNTSIGDRKYLNYADINLSNRPLTEGDLVITADGYLWKVLWNIQETIDATCIGKLEGESGAPGFSIYYSTEVRSVKPIVGSIYGLDTSKILTSGRTLQIGDLVVTVDGYLWSLHSLGSSTGSAICLGSIKGADGTGIYHLDASAAHSQQYPDQSVHKGFVFIIPDVNTNGKTLRKGDWLIDNEGLLCSVDYFDVTYGTAEIVTSLKGPQGDAGSVTSVNGVKPDANGNVQIEVGSGSGVEVTAKPGQLIRAKKVDENGKPTAWEAVPWGYTEGEVAHPIPGELLPEGYPHYEYGVLLEETGAIEQTDQTFGKVWVVGEVPKVELGKTYKIKYNGVTYNCQCMADPMNTAGDPDAVCFGNLSVIGGANTGEPFVILISPKMGMTIALDLAGATSVTIGIEGDAIVPFEGKYLPGSIYTVVFDIRQNNNTWQSKADKEFSDILEKAKDPNVLVRAFVRTHAMSIYYGSLDVLCYSYGELTNAASAELNFAIKENSANNLYLKMTRDGITVNR